MAKKDVSYGRIQPAEHLGQLLRAHRKGKELTLKNRRMLPIFLVFVRTQARSPAPSLYKSAWTHFNTP